MSRQEYDSFEKSASERDLVAEVDFGADCLWVYMDDDPTAYAVVVGCPDAMIALAGEEYGPNWCIQIHKDAAPVGDVSYEGPDATAAFEAFIKDLEKFVICEICGHAAFTREEIQHPADSEDCFK